MSGHVISQKGGEKAEGYAIQKALKDGKHDITGHLPRETGAEQLDEAVAHGQTIGRMKGDHIPPTLYNDITQGMATTDSGINSVKMVK